MPFMTRLPGDLAAFGLRVETVPGWETRGSSSFAPACVVGHWTAGPRGSVTRPSLNVVVNGRPDLDGPLCNVYLARDGVCVVVAAGRANHAGTGGFRGLVGNSAAYGIEAEAADNADWTAAQRAVYPRLVAAMLHGLGRDASWFCGHSEWAGPRKTDINGYTPTDMRAQAAATLANPTTEDDMPLNDDDLNKIADRVWHYVHPDPAKGGPAWQVDKMAGIDYKTQAALDAIASLPARVWAQPVPRPETTPMAAGDLLGWADRAASMAANNVSALVGLAAERAGLSDEDVKRVAEAAAGITAEDVASRLRVTAN